MERLSRASLLEGLGGASRPVRGGGGVALICFRNGSSMMIAFARSGYLAPTYITVAAPIEWPISMGL